MVKVVNREPYIEATLAPELYFRTMKHLQLFDCGSNVPASQFCIIADKSTLIKDTELAILLQDIRAVIEKSGANMVFFSKTS